MADFVLNAPGTTNNPWFPADVAIPNGSLQTDATLGIRNGGPVGSVTVFAHDADYGDIVVSEIVLSQFLNHDEIVPGAFVRTGANAGAGIGLAVRTTTTAKFRRYNAAGVETDLTMDITPPTNFAANDVIVVTYNRTTGTISATQNGLAIGTGATDSTYAAEPSLAAGGLLFYGNSNNSYFSSFSATGVAAEPNPGLRITDIHQPNNDSLVANASGVDAVVYDGVGGAKRWQGTVSIAGGGVVIDNDAVGDVDDEVFLVLRWLVANGTGSDEYTYAATETVINLDA